MPSNVDHRFVAPGAVGVDKDHPLAAHLRILDADAGRVALVETRKKIALCGFASSTRALIPVNDPAWVIVGLNQLYRHIPRADAWFDIHENWREDNVEGTDHPFWLAQSGIPIYMTTRQPEIPTSVRMPNDRLIEYFGIDYSTSTVAHMLQVFIYEIDQAVRARCAVLHGSDAATLADAQYEIKRIYGEYAIGIFGIDLIVGTEYEFQRQCAEFWIGQAEARGIEMVIPQQSALLKQLWRYGYQKEPAGHPFTLGELEKRRAALAKQRDEAMAMVNQQMKLVATLDGALQEQEMLGQVGNLRIRGGSIPLPGTE